MFYFYLKINILYIYKSIKVVTIQVARMDRFLGIRKRRAGGHTTAKLRPENVFIFVRLEERTSFRFVTAFPACGFSLSLKHKTRRPETMIHTRARV